MVNRRSDLVLHPVRLRIVLATSGREVTTAELRAELGDVPQASLYRHVSLLTEAGILEVAAERPVRGTVERTYRLAGGAGSFGADDAASMTPEQHEDAFTAFAGALVAAFGRYIRTPGADPSTDGIGYRQVPLWLDDAELAAMVEELRAVLERYADLGPDGDRVRRTFSSILIPDPRVEPAPLPT